MTLKNIKIILLIFFLSFSVLTVCLAKSPLNPDASAEMSWQGDVFAFHAGFDETATVGEIVAAVIKGFLGLLGIIFIVLMIYAGYLWMTAAGNEEDIKKAKDLIKAAIIGLIIIVAAYSITHFVFEAMSGPGGGNPEVGGSGD